MFQKPFKVKSQSLVKKSDKKKLHEQLLQANADVNKEMLEDLLPLKGDLGVTRVITHFHGEVFVYTNKKTPFFFTFQQHLCPTVYALWKYPRFLSVFTTHEFVFSRLQNGADLMLPGVMTPKTGLPHFNINQPCSVNLSGNLAPVAMGITQMGREGIVEGGVKNGKLLLVLHTFQDHLWELGEKVQLPKIPVEIFDEEKEENDVVNDEDSIKGVSQTLDSGLNIDDKSAEYSNDGRGEDVKNDGRGEDMKNDVDDKEGEDDDDKQDLYQHESIPDSMDDLLRVCFLYALKKYGKEMKMPLLTNLFYKNFMISCCPKDHPLQVKKSSYKKLSAFLDGMKDEGLIGVEGVSKGVESIVSVDFDHNSLKGFEIPAWQLNETQRNDEDDKDEDDWLNYSPPQFTPVFIIPAPLLDLLNFAEKRYVRGDVMTSGEAKDVLTAYVKSNALQEGRFVKLDILLTRVLLNKNDYTEVLPWSELMETLLKKMTQAHLVQLNGKTPYVQKGQIQHIQFDVKKKASNKKVTEVWNLGLFGLDVGRLANYIQRTVSCNAFVVHADDKSAQKDVLYVAGNQIHFIQKLLIDKYRLAAKNMTGLEKAIKKKGK